MRREEVSSYSWYSLAQTLKAKNGNHHHWCSGEERKHGFWTRNFTGSPSWTGRTNLTFCRHPRKQTAADLPTHVQDSPQRRLEDPQAYPGQIRYIIPSTSSGSALVEPGKPQELLIAAVSFFQSLPRARDHRRGDTRSYAVLKTKHMWRAGPLFHNQNRIWCLVWAFLFSILVLTSPRRPSGAIPDNWSPATRWRMCWSTPLLIFCLCTIFRMLIKDYQT